MDNSGGAVPPAGVAGGDFMQWQEDDLAARLPAMVKGRQDAGLEGLVGGLEAVVINTEPGRLEPGVDELLHFTGLGITERFVDSKTTAYVLATRDSPSLVIMSRGRGANPFHPFNQAEKARALPNTRLETFVFRVRDLDTYVGIQRGLGVRFLTERIVEAPEYRFIQTYPSRFTGNSLGFLEWKGSGRSFAGAGAKRLPITQRKPDLPWLSQIHGLDHTATRVRAVERNSAIIEFLSLTGYHFDFAVFVKSLNSITSVARLSRDDFAMVFTSGIAPYTDDEASGPTEKFIRSYGTRVHHMAFRTDEIEEVFGRLRGSGMDFLVDLVGSPDEGLKQTFSMPSPYTMVVNEYIHRYEGFDGFFTRSNVEALTRATGRQ